MIFNSVTYILFLVIIVLLYWGLPNRLKIWLIFLASIIFYGFWKVEFVSLMLISATNDYLVAQAIYKTPKENKKRRKWLLAISLLVNLGLLFYFKYLLFFTDNLSFLAQMAGFDVIPPVLNIILPLGISFYTFQTISYTVDVYRGFLKPEKDFVLYGSYVMFFPQLIAGPGLRACEVIDQLRVRPAFSLDFIPEGIKRILYGLFLKTVLADNIATSVDYGFGLPVESLSALDVWTLSFLFGFQIYFDFSAYSHIAIGSAKLMGISFPENFNFPYAANSFKAFWKRWHISLSSWIRDYLYLPLMGAKVMDRSTGGIGESVEQKRPAKSKKDRALFFTWAIMGLWHGANWTFVFWGLYHAVLIFMERNLSFIRKRLPSSSKNILGWAFTLPLAMLGWIPFRAQSMNDVFLMFQKIVNPFEYMSLGMRENVYIITVLMFLLTTGAYLAKTYLRKPVIDMPIVYSVFNVVKYTALIILVFTFLRPISQFIYFQF